jgi:hypothetical protein
LRFSKGASCSFLEFPRHIYANFSANSKKSRALTSAGKLASAATSFPGPDHSPAVAPQTQFAAHKLACQRQAWPLSDPPLRRHHPSPLRAYTPEPSAPRKKNLGTRRNFAGSRQVLRTQRYPSNSRCYPTLTRKSGWRMLSHRSSFGNPDLNHSR